MDFEKILSEVNFSFSRSSGAGGQHVNKVATKVTLHFDIAQSKGLSVIEKEQIHSRLANKINKEAVLVLYTDSSRSQHKNKKLLIDKFQTILEKALHKRKKRIHTKPSKEANIKRLKRKKNHAEKKKWRQRPDY